MSTSQQGSRLCPLWLRAILLCALLSFFIVWDSASTVRDAREWARKFPNLTRVPVELQDTSLSPARGKAVEYLGYQFEVPWDDLEQSKARLKAGFQPIPFHSGRLIIMEKRGPDEMVHDLQRDANSRRWLTRAWIYDKEAIASDYALTRAALYETPDKVRLLSWPFQANWSLYLLLMKGILVHGEGPFFQSPMRIGAASSLAVRRTDGSNWIFIPTRII